MEKVVFVITKEMIDELIEVGFYSFQIRLFDESQISRVTIPPVLKGIDIRNPIAAEDETNVVDIGLVDYAVVVKDEFEYLSTFLPDGNYNKTEWESKDVISGVKLNKIEDALYNINSNMEAADLALLKGNQSLKVDINKINKTVEKLEYDIDGKMNAGGSISVSQIDKTKGKLDQTYLSNELIAQIAGNAPINSVPADKSITNNMLTKDSVNYNNIIGFELDPRYNLIDVNSLNTKGFYDADGIWVDNSVYGSTGFIRINPKSDYKVRTAGIITLWDSDFNFISEGSVSGYNLIIPSDNVCFFNSAIALDEVGIKPKYLINTTQSIPDVEFPLPRYYSNNLLVNRANIDMESIYIDRDHVKFIGDNADNINLFDKSTASTTYYYDCMTGNKINSSSYCATNFMTVDYNKEYVGSSSGHITYWDENKKYLFGNNSNRTTINGDIRVKYCVMTYRVSDVDTWMCVEEANEGISYRPYNGAIITNDVKITKDNLNYDLFDKYLKIDEPASKNNADFIIRERTENLFNVENMNTKGYYSATSGVFVTSSTYNSSELIEVEEGEYYTIYPIMGHIAFFDSAKQFLGGTTDGSWSGPVSPGVKYISWVVTANNKYNTVIWKKPDRATSYIPYYTYTLTNDIILPHSKSELYGLKWNVLGDSISSTDYANGHPYWYHLKNDHNMTVRNYAKSGAWISDGGTLTISNIYDTMDDDADIITVFAGTNDDLSVNALGTMSDRTNTTFYGALHILYSGLVNKYPGKKIGVISIMSRSSYIPGDGGPWDRKNNAILEVAKYYNIPVFKAHEEFNLPVHIETIKNMYVPDGLHPNEAAHRDVMARRLKKWLESL